ncbi:hypothetical protein IE995_15135 [Klebsiella pneumoniae]|nr:hypothetical protein [Klebsiella pneumoniae]
MPWLFTPFFNLLSTLTKVFITLIYIGIFSLTLNALFCEITLHTVRFLVLLNRVRFRRKSKIPSILTGFSLDSSPPKRGIFLICDTVLLITPRKSATIHPVFLTLAGSVESAGKSRQAERLVTPIR